MDFVKSYFDTNEPLTSWTLLSSLFSRSFPDQCWSEKKSEDKRVQLVRGSFVRKCNFLQNPYFRYVVYQIRWIQWIRTDYNETKSLFLKEQSYPSAYSIFETFCNKGSFRNYVDKICASFTTYSPPLSFSMVWTLTKSGHFLDHLPTYLVL